MSAEKEVSAFLDRLLKINKEFVVANKIAKKEALIKAAVVFCQDLGFELDNKDGKAIEYNTDEILPCVENLIQGMQSFLEATKVEGDGEQDEDTKELLNILGRAMEDLKTSVEIEEYLPKTDNVNKECRSDKDQVIVGGEQEKNVCQKKYSVIPPSTLGKPKMQPRMTLTERSRSGEREPDDRGRDREYFRKSKWNGPGMKMLPEDYGESLHQHKSYVDDHEDWENSQNRTATTTPTTATATEVFCSNRSTTGSTQSKVSAGKTSVPVPKVYTTEEIIQEVSKEEERLSAVAKKYEITELAQKNENALLFTFLRPPGDRVNVVIVDMNGSQYIWVDRLGRILKEPNSLRECNLNPLLKNPTGSAGIKKFLSELTATNVRDLTLTSLRNYDRVMNIDVDLGSVLEVLHFNWKHPNNRISLL